MAAAELSILVLTKSCVSKFEEVIALHGPKQIELENRLADFSLWADGVGALSKPGSSLDSRLEGRVNDLAFVKNVLNTLVDCLDYAKEVFEAKASFDECIQNLDSIIGNLALIGVAIRRTGKASRNRRANRTFKPEEHQEFKTHLECIMLLRPTEEARFHHTENGACIIGLDHSELSPLQSRLIDANLRRRHNFVVAQKRSKHESEARSERSTPIGTFTAHDLLRDGPPPTTKYAAGPPGAQPQRTTQDSSWRAATISGFSLASTAEGTLHNELPEKAYIPGAAKTQITSIASDAEFPEPPPIPSGRRVGKCPCCCQSLPTEIFTDPTTWKQHIIEDLCPYTCIAENCPTPQLFFCTRSEWENHVKQSHLPSWQCPFCDQQDVRYPSIENMGSHIETKHNDELLENSLSTILSWSAVQTMGIKSCPLCSSRGPEDSSELVDHVLEHMYDFSLRALPWPPPPVQDLNVPPGNFNLPGNPEHADNIRKWINGAVHYEVDAPCLILCDYDRADHSFPTLANPFEYTDHFMMNEYFNESPKDTSSRRQTDQSRSVSRATDELHAAQLSTFGAGSNTERDSNSDREDILPSIDSDDASLAPNSESVSTNNARTGPDRLPSLETQSQQGSSSGFGALTTNNMDRIVDPDLERTPRATVRSALPPPPPSPGPRRPDSKNNKMIFFLN
ncbi:hypothetical protein F5Y08DRAFT_310998 [Xylaria arbuscula]|nr:hypothetical protein F5Y08DRAFT_310998 [Xylaria arbuscula]